MSHYRFCYDSVVNQKHGMHKVDIEAATPVSAINMFHRFVQTERELSADLKTVIRPILRDDQYVVRSMHQFYHDAALQRNPSEQPIVESVMDYASTKNPVLHVDGIGCDKVDSGIQNGQEFDFGPDNPTD